MRKRHIEHQTESSRDKFSISPKTEFSYGGNANMEGDYRRFKARQGSKAQKREVLTALERKEVKQLRNISRHFFDVSGVYARAARYIAYLPTYDSLLTPHVVASDVRQERVLGDFTRTMMFLDKLNLKTNLRSIALDVVVDGIFGGYLRESGDKVVLQKLPPNYIRSAYKIDGMPAVEFDVRYFDMEYHTTEQKLKVLYSFPPEVVEAYSEFRKGDVKVSYFDDAGAWVLLNPKKTCFFRYNEDGAPIFANAIPSIIDLDDMAAIERKRAEQQLLQMLIQKVPLTKDGDFIFDMTEAAAMHQNAVNMMGKNSTIDVLTTFADVDLHDFSSGDRKSANDGIEFWSKNIYSELGISQQLFATDGNLALEKSVMTDEALVSFLLLQIEDWLNYQIDQRFNRSRRKYFFKIWFPLITHNNRLEMAKLYKDQATLGYSKQLPAIALGQTQSNMVASLAFENEILGLQTIMKPLESSHTASGGGGEGKGGRPEKPAGEKSDKTMANKASQG